MDNYIHGDSAYGHPPDDLTTEQAEFLASEVLADINRRDLLFDWLRDEQITELIKAAQITLEERRVKRHKEALAEIRRLAKDNGLTVSLKKKPARKRGRRSKPKDEGNGER